MALGYVMARRCSKHGFLTHPAFEADDPVSHPWSILEAVVVRFGCAVVHNMEGT
jgi:hypothetical protein